MAFAGQTPTIVVLKEGPCSPRVDSVVESVEPS